MATFSEVVAAVVVHSSAAAFSHFGVTLDVPQVERPTPAAERVIARTPRTPRKIVDEIPLKSAECPEAQRGTVVKV